MKRIDKLDDLLHFVNNGHLDFYYNNQAVDFKNGFKKKIVNNLMILLYPFRIFFKSNKKIQSNLKNKDWFFYESINNYESLVPIYSKNKIFVKPNFDIIYRYIFIYKFIWLVPLLIKLIKENKLKWFFAYFEILGVREESIRILKIYKPQKIIFSNDHLPYQTAIKNAAHELNIKTYYFQHACVLNNFPKLNFSVSFLEGQDSLFKYKNVGEIRGDIELIGMLKARNFSKQVNKKNKVTSIGIAYNEYDNLHDIEILILRLKNEFSELTIFIRPHPADNRIIGNLKKSVEISNSKSENSFVFLGRIDLLISGDSSIHLDAVLMNVVSLYYNFSINNVFDVYSFVKNGLVQHIDNIEELVSKINNEMEIKTNVIDKAKYYDEYINSSCNFNSILNKYGFNFELEK